MEDQLDLAWVKVSLDPLRAVRFSRCGFSDRWGEPLLSLQEHEHGYSRVVRRCDQGDAGKLPKN
jgi:hypothetical protein